jgi:hypothetical protein
MKIRRIIILIIIIGLTLSSCKGKKEIEAPKPMDVPVVMAARRALMLTKAKYDAGFTSYLEVLIAESYAFDAELLASYTRGQQLKLAPDLGQQV